MYKINKFSVLNEDDSEEYVDDKKYKVFKTDVILKKKTNKNNKKILCHNMITYGSCSYGDKCLYAHTLKNQNIDIGRKQAWDILFSTDETINDVDLQKDHQLYRSFLSLTQLCKECNKGKCTGGYNCKFGACDEIYQVCMRDLNRGDCFDENCKMVHLTKKGIKPFYNIANTPIPNIIQCQKIKGTLLNEHFFEKNGEIDDELLSNFSEISDENDNIANECNKSIFEK